MEGRSNAKKKSGDKKKFKPTVSLPTADSTAFIRNSFAERDRKPWKNKTKPMLSVQQPVISSSSMPSPPIIVQPGINDLVVKNNTALILKKLSLATDVLSFGWELYQERQKNPDGAWMTYAVIGDIASRATYAPLYYLSAPFATAVVALDVLHQPLTDFKTHFENEYADKLHLHPRDRSFVERDLQEMHAQLALVNIATDLVDKLLTPLHIVENYFKETAIEIHDSLIPEGKVNLGDVGIDLLQRYFDKIQAAICQIDSAADKVKLNQFFGAVMASINQLEGMELPAGVTYIEFCKQKNVANMLASIDEKMIQPAAHQDTPSTRALQQASRFSLPEFSYEAPKPSPLVVSREAQDSTDATISDEPEKNQTLERVRDNALEVSLRSPAENYGVAKRENKPIGFQISAPGFGAVPGGRGGVGVRMDFPTGGGIGAGIAIAGNYAEAVIGLEIQFDSAFFTNLLGASGYAIPIGIVVGVGLFLYTGYQKRKAKKMEHHLKRNAIKTQNEVTEAHNYLVKMFPELLQLSQSDPAKFDQLIKETQDKLDRYLSKQDKRQKDSYKNDAFGLTNWISQMQRDSKQEAADSVMYLTWNKERSIYESSIVEANKDAKLDELVDKVKPLLSNGRYVKKEYFEKIILKDLIIQRALSNSDYQFLKDNPWLFAKETQLSPYDMPDLVLLTDLVNYPREILDKHGKRTDTAKRADAIMMQIRGKYVNLKKIIESGGGKTEIEAAIGDILSYLQISKSDLEAVKIKGDDKHANAYEYNKSVLDEVFNIISSDSRLGSVFDLDMISKGCDFYIDNKDQSADVLIELAKSSGARGDDKNEAGSLWALRRLTVDKFFILVAKGKTDEANKLISQMSDVVVKPMADSTATPDSLAIITKKTALELTQTANFCEANKSTGSQFWLDQLRKQGDRLADKSIPAEEKPSPEVTHLINQQGAGYVYADAAQLSGLGYHAKAKELYDGLDRELSKQGFDTTQDKQNSKAEGLSFQGQVLDPAVNAVQGFIEGRVKLWAPSKTKSVVSAALSATRFTQKIVPSIVTLGAQGLHSLYAGNMATFNAHVGKLSEGVVTGFKDPLHHFNAGMLYAQIAIKGFEKLPFNYVGIKIIRVPLECSQEFVTWASPVGFKLGYSANTVYQLYSTGFKSVYRGMHVTSLLGTAADLGFSAYHRYEKNNGYACESMTRYRVEQGVSSGLTLTGTVSVLWFGAASGGVGYLAMGAGAVVAAYEGYNNFSTTALQGLASQVINNALTNIKVNLEKIKSIKEATADKTDLSAVKLITPVIRSSCGIIKKELTEQFGGLRFNEKQTESINDVRVSYLHYMALSYFEEGNFSEVVKLTNPIQNLAKHLINTDLHLPAYLTVNIMELRLYSLALLSDGLDTFYQDYEFNVRAVVAQASNDWLRKHLSSAKDSWSRTVKVALQQFVVKAYGLKVKLQDKINQDDVQDTSDRSESKLEKEEIEARIKLYLKCLQYSYSYCKAEELLDDKLKFKAATLAYHMQERELCQKFMSTINFTLLKKDMSPTYVTQPDLVMLADLCNDEYLQLYHAPSVEGVIGAAEIKLNISYLLSLGHHQLVIQSLLKMKDYPGKYSSLATAAFAASGGKDVARALKYLLGESKKDLVYWSLLFDLLNECFKKVDSITDSAKQHESCMKLLAMLRVCAEYIQREQVEAKLFELMRAAILDANEKLHRLAPYFLNKTRANPSEAEIAQWIKNLIDYTDRCVRNVSDLSMRNEVENLLITLNVDLSDAVEEAHDEQESSSSKVWDDKNINDIYMTALSLLKLGDKANAYQGFCKVIDRDPKHADALYEIGCLYRGKNDGGEKAIEYFIEARKGGHPDADRQIVLIKNAHLSDQAWYELGLNYLAQNNKNLARCCFESAAVNDHIDAIEKLLTFDCADLVSSQQWHELGLNYMQGSGTVAQNYTVAMVCFSKAIKLSDKHANSFYMLGLLHYQGFGVDKNDIAAKDCFYKAAMLGDSDAFTHYVKIHHADISLVTADEWYALGNQYHLGRNNVAPNFIFARFCYEKVLLIDANHVATLSHAGLLYENGNGVIQSVDTAKRYYESAIQGKCTQSTTHLNRLYSNYPNHFTATEWLSLTKDISTDQSTLRVCYENVLYHEPNNITALCSLALFCQAGLGGPVNTVLAKTYNQRAMANGSDVAKYQLAGLCLEAPDMLSTEEWYSLGDRLRERHPERAKRCYEVVLDKTNGKHADALFYLGLMSEYGLGTPVDKQEAMFCYQRAAALGCSVSKNKVNAEHSFARRAINWTYSLFGASNVPVASKEAAKRTTPGNSH